MEILVDIAETDGRLEGTVRRVAAAEVHPFSGRLELLACLERALTSEDEES